MNADQHHRPRPWLATPPADTPTLSLVVVSSGSPDLLRDLLERVYPAAAAHAMEVLVMRAGGAETAAELAREFPRVRLVPAPADATAESLRFAGMAAARGDVVMLARDDDPAVEERLLHICRRYAGAERTAEAADPRAHPLLPARERAGGMERAGAPRWVAAI